MKNEIEQIAKKLKCEKVLVNRASYLVEDFLADAPFYLMYDWSGAFDVKSKSELIQKTAQKILQNQNPRDFLMQYKSAKSFLEAKREVVQFFKVLNAEIRLSLRLSKALKKPKQKRVYKKKNTLEVKS